jgi:hypothetical protein
MPEFPRMLVEVGGGLVQRIYSDGPPHVYMHVIDHDEDKPNAQEVVVEVVDRKVMDNLLRPEGEAVGDLIGQLEAMRSELGCMVSIDHWDESGNLVNDLYPVCGVDDGPLHSFAIIYVDQREIAKVHLTEEEMR